MDKDLSYAFLSLTVQIHPPPPPLPPTQSTEALLIYFVVIIYCCLNMSLNVKKRKLSSKYINWLIKVSSFVFASLPHIFGLRRVCKVLGNFKERIMA